MSAAASQESTPAAQDPTPTNDNDVTNDVANNSTGSDDATGNDDVPAEPDKSGDCDESDEEEEELGGKPVVIATAEFVKSLNLDEKRRSVLRMSKLAKEIYKWQPCRSTPAMVIYPGFDDKPIYKGLHEQQTADPVRVITAGWSYLCAILVLNRRNLSKFVKYLS